MFIGREIELAQLEGAYSESGFKFFAVQGRRGIGKTALIEEFCRNKPTIFFSPVFGDGKANLTHFSWSILHHYNDEKHPAFQYWQDALNYIAGKNERVILVIDDADQIVAKIPVLLKVFDKVFDSVLKDSKIFMIFSLTESVMLKGLLKKAIVMQLGKYLTAQNVESLKREELKHTVMRQAKFIQIPADTVIIREGETNDDMYKIISGRAICAINHGTDEEYLLGSLKEGKTFGEYSLLSDNPGIYTVTAYSDMLLLRISRSEFEDFIQMNAGNSVNIMRNMAAMLRVLKVNIDMLNEELHPKE